jgi:hypothetical protein
VIDRRRLLRALDRRDVADWTLVERAQEFAIATADLHRSEQRTKWQLTLHHDSPQGRGSAHVTIDSIDGDAVLIVEQAIALAISSTGPAWQSSPLAAPARVKLADETLLEGDLLAKLGSEPISTMREQVRVAMRGGLRTEWTATLVDAGGRTARRLADVPPRPSLPVVTGRAEAGPCSLVLRPEALLHGGLGVWEAFVTQADAVVERQGLTRYREKTPIAPGAETVAEPLSIASDGALDYALLSAPMGDEGGAVRRFSIIERGIASGLGLPPREAALRKRDPNGGVRNLDVELGSWPGDVSGQGRVVEVLQLRDLAIDRYTGDASLEIAIAVDHPKGTVFAGGSIRLDLIAVLARAKRSQTRLTRGAYRGPDAVWIDAAELIA